MSVTEVQKAAAALEAMTKEQTKTLAAYDKQLTEIDDKMTEQRKERYPNLAPLEAKRAELSDKRDGLAAAYADGIAKRQAALDDANKREGERLTLEARQAGKAEKAAKQRARLAWEKSGGRPEAFEQAWPRIREGELIEKTRERLSDNARPVIDF